MKTLNFIPAARYIFIFLVLIFHLHGFAQTSISYSNVLFQEASDNDGSIRSSSVITCSGLTFTGSNGDDFIANGKVVVTNLPSGLSASMTRTSNLTLALAFSGCAVAHLDANDVTNLTFTFQNAAFSNNNAAAVTNYNLNNLKINFFSTVMVGTGQTYTTINSALLAFYAKGVLGNYNTIHLTDALYNEDKLSIYNNLTIEGNGAQSTGIRALDVALANHWIFMQKSDSVTLKNLYLTNASGNTFGGGYNAQNNKYTCFENVIFKDNSASFGSGLSVISCEGVYILNCTFNTNASTNSNSHGGAIYANNSKLYIRNSTLTGNGVQGNGGAIYIGSGSDVQIFNSTIAKNTSQDYGGGIYLDNSSLTIKNTIIADNLKASVSQDYYAYLGSSITDQGYNIVKTQNGITSAYFSSSTDILYNFNANKTATTSWNRNSSTLSNQNLNLASALADNSTLNGTQTLALTAGSFAINAGSNTGNPVYDQRYMLINSTRDIGAYEYAGTVPVSTSVTTSAISNLTANAATLNGNITVVGSISPSSYGFCWTTGSGDPTVADSKHDLGSKTTTGSFTFNYSSLKPRTTYKVRAYASSVLGNSYGTTVSFDVPANCTWNGSSNTSFNDAGNWLYGTTPIDGDNVIIAASANRNLVLDQNRSLGDINFNNNTNNIVIELGNFNLTASTVTNYNSTHYIKTTGSGELKMTVSSEGTLSYPVGLSDYSPVSLTNHTGSSDQFGVTLASGVTMDGSSSGTALTDYLVNRTIIISKTNANASNGYDLTLAWNDADKTNITTPQIFEYDNTLSSWKNSGSTSSTGNNATITGYKGNASKFFVGNLVDMSWDGSSYSPAITPAFYTNLTINGNNLSTNGLKVNNLVLNAGKKMTANGTVNVLGTLTLKCTDTDGDAQILNTGTVTVTGQTILEKKFELGKWYFFSLPYEVTASNIFKIVNGVESQATWGDPFGGAYTYGYDIYVGEYDGYNRDHVGFPASSTFWVNPGTHTLLAKKGYIMALSGMAAITFRFKSVAGASTVTGGNTQLTVSKYVESSNTYNNSWNLVGNPYTSGYDLSSASYQKPYYIYNGSTYTVLIGDNSDNADARKLAPYTSFFLQATTTSANTVDFATAGQVIKAPSIVQTPDYEVISLILSKDGMEDLTRIRVGNDFTENYELGKDAAKIKSLNTMTPQLSSILNSMEYSVNSVPASVNEIQLRTFCPSPGTYSIGMRNMDLCSHLSICELYDTQTSLKIDLLNQTQYEFTSDAGSYDRFKITMVKDNTTDAREIELDNGIQLCSVDGYVQITGITPGSTVSIYDLSGKVINSTLVSDDMIRIQLPYHGLYVVKTENKDKAVTRKLML